MQIAAGDAKLLGDGNEQSEYLLKAYQRGENGYAAHAAQGELDERL